MSRKHERRRAENPRPETRGDEISAPVGQSGIGKHLIVAALGVLLTYLFWASRMEWDEEMRTWRAFGDSAFILLVAALAIGPVVRLWPKQTARIVNWRRALGIWFTHFALVHAYLVWDGWARWSVRGLLGYQDLPQTGTSDPVLVDPGFGLANLIGLAALFWALVLLATSSDRAMRFLGGRTWKQIHLYANVIFYLVALHAAYFLFLHYELSLRNLVFRTGVPDPNWFRFWFLGLVALVFSLQSAATVKAVVLQRKAFKEKVERG